LGLGFGFRFWVLVLCVGFVFRFWFCRFWF